MESPEGLKRVFFPWIDMANNADDPNTILTQSKRAIHLHTLRAVAKGEEVSLIPYTLNRASANRAWLARLRHR